MTVDDATIFFSENNHRFDQIKQKSGFNEIYL